MNELERLRAEVRKRHADATKKVSRIRNVNGVEIGGSEYDPRRAPSVVKRYNKIQLANYLAKLNVFQSRSVGFLSGVEGAAIPRARFQELKRLERRYNAIGRKHVSKIADVFIPETGMTVGEREASILPSKFLVRANGSPTNAPFSPSNRKPQHIKDAAALEKIISQMSGKTTKGYLPKQIKDSRKQLKQMLTDIGASDMIKLANRLTDEQFDVLWNYTPYASDVSRLYFVKKSMETNGEKRWHAQAYEDNINDARERLKWALTVPTSKTQTTQGQKRPASRRR